MTPDNVSFSVYTDGNYGELHESLNRVAIEYGVAEADTLMADIRNSVLPGFIIAVGAYKKTDNYATEPIGVLLFYDNRVYPTADDLERKLIADGVLNPDWNKEGQTND